MVSLIKDILSQEGIEKGTKSDNSINISRKIRENI